MHALIYNSQVLENVATAKSWDSIKKGTSNVPLRTFFAAVFCTPQAFLTAQREFMRSLVPYSILTYLFQVRSNENIVRSCFWDYVVAHIFLNRA